MQIRSYRPEDHAALARLCWAYRDLLAERTAIEPLILKTYYAKDDYARLIDDLPRIHAPPKGDILLAEHEGQIIGCAMYYPLAQAGLTEIKRVYVDPSARGLGAGRALFEAAMTGARAAGYDRMVLDTMVALTEAIALYGALGFNPAEPFYELDARFAPYIRFFGKDL